MSQHNPPEHHHHAVEVGPHLHTLSKGTHSHHSTSFIPFVLNLSSECTITISTCPISDTAVIYYTDRVPFLRHFLTKRTNQQTKKGHSSNPSSCKCLSFVQSVCLSLHGSLLLCVTSCFVYLHGHHHSPFFVPQHTCYCKASLSTILMDMVMSY